MKVINVTRKVLNTEETKLVRGFREGEKKDHKGVDLVPKSTAETPEVLAYDSGTVIQVQNYEGTTDSVKNPGMGTSCAIKHADGSVTRYQHLKYNSLRVKKGDKVKKGQMLGLFGRPTSGNSTGPHLHWDISHPVKPSEPFIKSTFCGETRYYVNPIPYLTKSEAKEPAKMKVTANALNVRSGPDKSFRVAKVIYKGDTVTVYEKKNNFGRIGADQWCCLDYLK